MKRIGKIIFSMELTGILLMLFAIAIGVATFIENDFGTLTAKAKVYNAKWFEFMLLLTAINLTGSIFKNKLYLKHRWPVFLFHIAFLFIFIGAAVTRYIGYEGMMRIREGATESRYISDETYLRVWANDGQSEVFGSKEFLASPVDARGKKLNLKVGNRDLKVRVVDYYTNASQTWQESETGDPLLWLVISAGNSGRTDLYMRPGDVKMNGRQTFSFEVPDEGDVRFFTREGSVWFTSTDSVEFVNMMAGITQMLAPDSAHMLMQRALYKFGDVSVVFKSYLEHAQPKLLSSGEKSGSGTDAVLCRLISDGQTVEVPAFGGKGFEGTPVTARVGDLNVTLQYGSVMRELPFAIKLIDFQLERYPGSNSPSSYASEVVLIDQNDGVEMPYRIYMNHILNYKGYRFFQSSYDRDERGTILSVNHDAAGTIITYIGYLLMAIGMFLTLFTKHSRFRTLGRLSARLRDSRKAAVAVLLVLGLVSGLQAQNVINPEDLPTIDKEHASEFGRLLVQDQDGRIKPVNTLASEVLRKVARKTRFYGLNPEQVMLGIMVYPEVWTEVPMIKIAHPELAELLGVEGKYASFSQIVDLKGGGGYKLSRYVEEAYAKKPAEQSKFDKEVMKVDERVNVFYLTYTGNFLRAFPIPDDPDYKWVTAADYAKFSGSEDAGFVQHALHQYFNDIATAVGTGDWSQAREDFNRIRAFQDKYGAAVIPSEKKINMEITYNRINIFKRLAHYYLYVGFILLLLQFISILRPKLRFGGVIKVGSILVVLLFVLYTAGLIMRWYISGHAPWSNGYESLLYIGWATALAGLLFLRRSVVTLSVTAVLASILLTVAGMSWMDPEITPLVPVLKSYWLIIHVAIITASYGFLALAALLGLFNLILMMTKTRKNVQRFDLTITELSHIIEMTMIVGLFMLTVGTFLGGVWANESWGRYWGWDPKETWALVTVLVYSFVVHMRFIPGFRGNFALSFAALISYSSVLMTYFGVNYYLSGLHSYAAGDPVPVPDFVYYSAVGVIIIGIIAWYMDHKHRAQVNS